MSEPACVALASLVFAVSVIAMCILQLVLWRFLRSYGVSIGWFYVSTPGYLDHKYISWCVKHNRRYRLIIALRILLQVTAVISVVVLYMRHK